MPGLDFIKRYQEGRQVTETPAEETPEERPIAVNKPAPSKGPYALPTPVGKTAVDESILERMQQLINEREARKGSLSEAILDAQAWWSGGQAGPYRALTERRAQKEADEATTFQMRRDLAQQRLAQERARAKILELGGPQPGSVGAGAAPSVEGGPSIFGENPAQIKFLVDVVRDPATKAIVMNQLYGANPDPDAAEATIKAYVAKNSGDTELIKDLRFAEANGLLTKDALRNIAQLRIAGGPEAFKPIPFTGVIGGKPGTYERQPLAAAAQLGGPAPAPMAAPAQRPPVPGMAAPQATPSAMPAAPTAAPTARPPMAAPAAAAPSAPTAAPAVAPIAAPAAPQMPAAQAPRPAVSPAVSPVSREDVKIMENVESTRGQERAKASEKDREEFKTQTSSKTLSDHKIVSDRIATLVKNNPKIAGVLSDPDFFNGLAELVKTGISTPKGPIGLGPSVEEFIFNSLPSTDFPDKVQRRELASYLARFELINSQLVKGQGQVSNAERQIIRDASVSISDPAELIYKRAKMESRSADLYKELSQIYKSKDFNNFDDFSKDPKYQDAFKRYENDVQKIVNEEVVLTKANVKANKVRQRKQTQISEDQMPEDVRNIIRQYVPSTTTVKP